MDPTRGLQRPHEEGLHYCPLSKPTEGLRASKSCAAASRAHLGPGLHVQQLSPEHVLGITKSPENRDFAIEWTWRRAGRNEGSEVSLQHNFGEALGVCVFKGRMLWAVFPLLLIVPSLLYYLLCHGELRNCSSRVRERWGQCEA